MNRTSLRTGFFLSLLAVLSTATFYFFSMGPDGFRPLVWIAPVPVLFMAMRSSRRSTSVMAFSAYLLGGLSVAQNLAQSFTPMAAAGSALLQAVAFALVVIAFRDAILHLRRPAGLLAFPVGWTSYEYILSVFSAHASAGSIAYTQSEFHLLAPIASLTGMVGIAFLVTLVPAAIAYMLTSREKTAYVPLMVTLALFFGVLLLGWIQPAGFAGTQVPAATLFNTLHPDAAHTLRKDWFAWVNLACLLTLLVAVSLRLLRRGKQGKQSPANPVQSRPQEAMKENQA